jgi:hypothetical protein
MGEELVVGAFSSTKKLEKEIYTKLQASFYHSVLTLHNWDHIILYEAGGEPRNLSTILDSPSTLVMPCPLVAMFLNFLQIQRVTLESFEQKVA